jgi:hypothetical protein
LLTTQTEYSVALNWLELGEGGTVIVCAKAPPVELSKIRIKKETTSLQAVILSAKGSTTILLLGVCCCD